MKSIIKKNSSGVKSIKENSSSGISKLVQSAKSSKNYAEQDEFNLELNKVLVEFDAYEVLEENNNQLLIKKLNDENNQTNWVEKRQFLK